MSNLKGKTILVQGAGRGNLGLVQAAREEGVRTVITGMEGEYPCKPLADVLRFADITDVDAVLRIAEEEKVDGAIICCSDTGLRAVGRINDRLHLTGVSEQAAVAASDKAVMKALLQKAGVRTAAYEKVRNAAELEEAVSRIGYPVIIKATDLQGSRGIFIVREPEALHASYAAVMAQTRKDSCLVEEFLTGSEFGAQAFVYQGEILFVLLHGDETVTCGTAVPVGHFMPLALSPTLEKDVRKQAEGAIRALGLDNCAVNIDFIERDGKAYILELTGRVGANCLPELTGNYFGINYYKMILLTALGESPLPLFAARRAPVATLSRMIRSEAAGTVRSVRVPDIPGAEIHLFVREGSPVRVFTNCNDAVGEVIVQAQTLPACETLMAQVMSEIKIEVQ